MVMHRWLVSSFQLLKFGKKTSLVDFYLNRPSTILYCSTFLVILSVATAVLALPLSPSRHTIVGRDISSALDTGERESSSSSNARPFKLLLRRVTPEPTTEDNAIVVQTIHARKFHTDQTEGPSTVGQVSNLADGTSSRKDDPASLLDTTTSTFNYPYTLVTLLGTTASPSKFPETQGPFRPSHADLSQPFGIPKYREYSSCSTKFHKCRSTTEPGDDLKLDFADYVRDGDYTPSPE